MEQPPAPQETLRQGSGAPRFCSKCGQKVGGTLSRCPLDGAPLLSAEAVARVGTRMGDYEIEGVIGEGGVGVVYRGRHVVDDRQVAIKVLHDHWAERKDLVEQFAAEAQAASDIHHAHLIDMIDLGTTPYGTVFLATEYLEGESLRDRLRQTVRLPLFDAINILRQVARGLGTAHAAGIVHGALKPSNIFLCARQGRRRIVRRSKAIGMRLLVEPEESFDLVKLLDFGMARFLDLPSSAQGHAGDGAGTAQYLSPERIEGRPADQKSDIYSLGAVFYEMVTGTVPFGKEWLADALNGQISDVVVAPSRRTPRAGIDARIDALVLRCLKKNPALRFSSTDELCEALDACVTDCAFLRDAHRLPGIGESGIDLSEASPEARQAPAQAAEQPAESPVAEPPAAAPVAEQPAPAPLAPPPQPMAAPVAEEPAAASVATKPTRPLVTLKPPAAPVAEQPKAAPVAEKPSVAPAPQSPAPRLVWPKPAAAPVAKQAAPARAVAQPKAAPVARKPAGAPFVAKPAAAQVADDLAAATSPPPAATAATAATADTTAPAAPALLSEVAPIADDPFAAMLTPAPALATADDPAASLITPAPVTAVVDAHAEIAAAIADEVGLRPVERGDAIASALLERPDRLDVPDDVSRRHRRPASARRPVAGAWAGLLLLGTAGAALWATHGDWPPSLTALFVAARTVPTATAPPSLPRAAAPAAAPTPQAPAAPASPTPAPIPPAPAPVAAPVAPAPPAAAEPTVAPPKPEPAAPASAVAPPKPEPAAPAKTAKAKAKAVARGPNKPATARGRARASSAGGRAPDFATPFETLPAAQPESAPAAEPEPTAPSKAAVAPESPPPSKGAAEPEPPPPSKAAAEPEPTAPSPPSAADLVREAQQARARGHHALAIGKAEEALKADPKPAQAMQAYETIGISSCAIGDADAARAAASHLGDAKRESVKAACEKRGVTIE